MTPLPVAVFVSGSGSNLAAILDRQATDPNFGAKVVLVLSDRPGVRALQRAEAAGVPTEVVDWAAYGDRETFTGAVCDATKGHGAEAIILAGFMRILGPEAIAQFPLRILNTHPALSPAFAGVHAIREAIRYGVKVTGVTVHFVDEQVDHGPIIAQQAIRVDPADDETSLLARVQAVEHRLYPDAIDAFAKGRLRVEGRKVIWQ